MKKQKASDEQELTKAVFVGDVDLTQPTRPEASKSYMERSIVFHQLEDERTADLATEFGDGTQFKAGDWVLQDYREGRYMRVPIRKPIDMVTRYVVARDKRNALLNERALHRSFVRIDRARDMAKLHDLPVFEVTTKIYVKRVK